MKNNIPNSDDSWAQIELYRHQYGELPPVGDDRKLDARAGMLAMADAIEAGVKGRDPERMPSPVSVIAVMRYAAQFVPTLPEPYKAPRNLHQVLNEILRHIPANEQELTAALNRHCVECLYEAPETRRRVRIDATLKKHLEGRQDEWVKKVERVWRDEEEPK